MLVTAHRERPPANGGGHFGVWRNGIRYVRTCLAAIVERFIRACRIEGSDPFTPATLVFSKKRLYDMPKPKMDIGDLVVLPHPDRHIIGEIKKVSYDDCRVQYGVRWWDGTSKHFGTFPESEVSPEE